MLILEQFVEKGILKINHETKKLLCTGLTIYSTSMVIECFVFRPWRL